MITDAQWIEMGFDPRDQHDWPIMCIVEREMAYCADYAAPADSQQGDS